MNRETLTERQNAVKPDQIFMNQADELLHRARAVGHCIEGRTQHAIEHADSVTFSNDSETSAGPRTSTM
jgi:hypothetical protein